MTLIVQMYIRECGHWHDALTTQHPSSVEEFYQRMLNANVKTRVVEIIDVDY